MLVPYLSFYRVKEEITKESVLSVNFKTLIER